MFSNVHLSRSSPYTNEIIGHHQCGFRRNRSSTDQTFCIRQILETKWEHNETEFGVTMKQVRLIKICLNETYSKVRIGEYLSNSFPIQNGLKQGDAL
jgi:hypothetical protein